MSKFSLLSELSLNHIWASNSNDANTNSITLNSTKAQNKTSLILTPWHLPPCTGANTEKQTKCVMTLPFAEVQRRIRDPSHGRITESSGLNWSTASYCPSLNKVLFLDLLRQHLSHASVRRDDSGKTWVDFVLFLRRERQSVHVRICAGDRWAAGEDKCAIVWITLVCL